MNWDWKYKIEKKWYLSIYLSHIKKLDILHENFEVEPTWRPLKVAFTEMCMNWLLSTCVWYQSHFYRKRPGKSPEALSRDFIKSLIILTEALTPSGALARSFTVRE